MSAFEYERTANTAKLKIQQDKDASNTTENGPEKCEETERGADVDMKSSDADEEGTFMKVEEQEILYRSNDEMKESDAADPKAIGAEKITTKSFDNEKMTTDICTDEVVKYSCIKNSNDLKTLTDKDNVKQVENADGVETKNISTEEKTPDRTVDLVDSSDDLLSPILSLIDTPDSGSPALLSDSTEGLRTSSCGLMRMLSTPAKLPSHNDDDSAMAVDINRISSTKSISCPGSPLSLLAGVSIKDAHIDEIVRQESSCPEMHMLESMVPKAEYIQHKKITIEGKETGEEEFLAIGKDNSSFDNVVEPGGRRKGVDLMGVEECDNMIGPMSLVEESFHASIPTIDQLEDLKLQLDALSPQINIKPTIADLPLIVEDEKDIKSMENVRCVYI